MRGAPPPRRRSPSSPPFFPSYSLGVRALRLRLPRFPSRSPSPRFGGIFCFFYVFVLRRKNKDLVILTPNSGSKAGRMEEGEAKKTGLEGTGLSLPGSSHGNLRSAGSDQQLKQMLDSLKSSKSPVSMAAPPPASAGDTSLFPSFKSTHGTTCIIRCWSA